MRTEHDVIAKPGHTAEVVSHKGQSGHRLMAHVTGVGKRPDKIRLRPMYFPSTAEIEISDTSSELSHLCDGKKTVHAKVAKPENGENFDQVIFPNGAKMAIDQLPSGTKLAVISVESETPAAPTRKPLFRRQTPPTEETAPNTEKPTFLGRIFGLGKTADAQ